MTKKETANLCYLLLVIYRTQLSIAQTIAYSRGATTRLTHVTGAARARYF